MKIFFERKTLPKLDLTQYADVSETNLCLQSKNVKSKPKHIVSDSNLYTRI